ncbi:MAG: hypothetical protein J6Y78_03420, partial [Paludibacteraceae bacterium]|nr:hypothetical protein [Paludibacteraceae bacterium]
QLIPSNIFNSSPSCMDKHPNLGQIGELCSKLVQNRMSSDVTDSLRRTSEDITARTSKKCLKRFFSKMMIFQKKYVSLQT